MHQHAQPVDGLMAARRGALSARPFPAGCRRCRRSRRLSAAHRRKIQRSGGCLSFRRWWDEQTSAAPCAAFDQSSRRAGHWLHVRRQRRGELIAPCPRLRLTIRISAGAQSVQRHDRGARRAARAQNAQRRFPFSAAGARSSRSDARKAGRVGIAPFDPAIVVEDQQIDGAGRARPPGPYHGRSRKRLPCAGS